MKRDDSAWKNFEDFSPIEWKEAYTHTYVYCKREGERERERVFNLATFKVPLFLRHDFLLNINNCVQNAKLYFQI